ncbi:tripartite tricarboxylate transporter permease [Marinimicrobium sp. C6131]|uniref:tripartite tricarboxylate transporter permease n=1 Tax=Marinimicrobium sp. C6131 TaxID=3022676 RepID=UPI00223E4579|nr:tripartite tricarboxylate transporter permease [Marinimicrobium sp. C6131]UZJ42846.1 tripartite tricarboxylate transporter permease [Marinimicrobium sp. C6131]
MIELFVAGVWELLQPQVLIVLFLACIVGLVIGALPGLNATMAVAIILPLTFSFNAHLGMATLVAVYIGGICGGLVSAILLRIPGTPSSVATTFDGYPLAQQGQAVKALGTAMLASYAGGMFSLLVLVMFAPMVARLAINFGPAEYFALSVMALTMVAALAGKSLVKGAITALLGMAFSMVGMAPIDGTPRFTFGEINLWAGIGLVPFMIGLFAISQVLRELFRETPRPKVDMTIKGVGVTLGEIKRNIINVFRSSGIGVGIGVLPGIGGAASNMIAYATARQSSRNPDSFGKGNVDGVWASESAGNASIGGALLPLITLGIPGDGVTAIIIGGFMIHGLQPGPLLFTDNPDIVGIIYAAFFIACTITLLFQLATLRIFPRVLMMPRRFLLPAITVLAVMGAYAADNNPFDIGVMLAFGVLGFVLEKYRYPLSPMVLGFILGPILETNLRRALMLTDGQVLPMVTQPVAAGFLVVALAILIISLIPHIRRKQVST